MLDAATRAKFEDFAPNPEAEALVFTLRGQLTQLSMERGAAPLQIGRTYRYREGLRPEPMRLLEAVKRAVDPNAVGRIPEADRLYFKRVVEAREAGLLVCPSCDPWEPA